MTTLSLPVEELGDRHATRGRDGHRSLLLPRSRAAGIAGGVEEGDAPLGPGVSEIVLEVEPASAGFLQTLIAEGMGGVAELDHQRAVEELPRAHLAAAVAPTA
jgi:hypothetical protein